MPKTQKQMTFDFDVPQKIETVVITPTKEMPLEVFKKLHHLAYFMEFMKKLPDGKRLWDPKTTSIYFADLAEAEYIGLQKGWFHCDMEIPKVVYEQILGETENA